MICSIYFSEPAKDLEKLNQDHSCCICLEDYVDGKGNPIIPEPSPETETPHPQYDVIHNGGPVQEVIMNPNVIPHNSMSNNFEILQLVAAKNRQMTLNSTSYPATVPHSAVPNGTHPVENCNVDKDGGLVLGLLKCGHAFHFECIWKWMQSRTKCPVCRSHTLLNQDEIQAVSLFAVLPDLDPTTKSQNKSKSNSENLKQLDMPEVHHPATTTKAMCVFSVQTELEYRQLPENDNTTEKKQKRLPRTKLDLGRDGQHHPSQNKQHAQNRTMAPVWNPQQFRGQGVL